MIRKKIIIMLVISLMTLSAIFVSSPARTLTDNSEKAWETKEYNSEESINFVTYTKASGYSQLVGWYENLESEYPNYVDVFKANEDYGLGEVNGGYDCYYVRITNENLGLHKPEVLYLGSPHGDETVGTNCLYWFADWLLRMALTDTPCPNYDKDWLKWLLDNREIYIEVAHNPYGFDHGPQRYDGHGWDLNREADHDGPGSPTGGVWASIPGQTLYHFVNDHQIRCGADFHGGTRMLLYSWSSSHDNIYGTSPLTGYSYSHAPPDFYFHDSSSLRCADYIGDYGGDMGPSRVGTIPDTVGYEAQGGMTPWGYGADVVANPAEDPYVNDEIFGNYPGSGILWVTPEWSYTKNEPESTYGGDNDPKYGAEIRRYCLHQTDLAQPYVRWSYPNEDLWIGEGTPVTFQWQVNGSMVVDHTQLQWGTDPDPINHPQNFETDYDDYEGEYVGGTGWEGAESGTTNGVTWEETIQFTEPGGYYFVAKAQVDQIYDTVLNPTEYGNDPYLRLIKERTDPNYHEEIQGADGTETIDGQIWWYSPIIHVAVGEDSIPPTTYLQIDGTMGDNGWYKDHSFVEFGGTDDISGINYTNYKINDGDWEVYTEPFSPGQGEFDIQYYSIDFAGNEEEIKTGSFKIDYGRPKTTAILAGDEGSEGWFRSDVTVSFDATDSVSGIADTYYEIDDSDDWEIYIDPFDITTCGEHIIKFYSYDNAGVKEENREEEFTIDLNLPLINIDYPLGGEDIVGNIDIQWTASDGESDPVINLYYQINNGEWELIAEDEENDGIYQWDTTSYLDGEAKLKIEAEDLAGNIESDITSTFIIDNSEPPLTPPPPQGKTSGKSGDEYTYTATTTDPDNDLLYFKFSWGDETESNWIGPVESGHHGNASHVWLERGNYEIRVKARDEHGEETDWSDPLPIEMPKTKSILTIWEKIRVRFKIIDWFLRIIELI